MKNIGTVQEPMFWSAICMTGKRNIFNFIYQFKASSLSIFEKELVIIYLKIIEELMMT